MLKEIDAQDVPRFRIFNKIDHVGDAAAQAEREAALRADYPGTRDKPRSTQPLGESRPIGLSEKIEETWRACLHRQKSANCGH
ncbi:MAG: hypothetical protein U0938_00975 [Thiobacillus sp.]|nr:hypothetical protein [Thiobacillus sp.]